MDEPVGERIVRVTPDERRADEWDLVLHAEAVPHRVALTAWGYAFAVPSEESARAALVLDAFERENRRRRGHAVIGAGASTARSGHPASRAEAAASDGVAWTGAAVALALVALQWVARTRGWHEAGVAVSDRLLHGEPWLAITALTLHADAAHLLGNAAFATIIVGLLARRVGGGVAVLLVLLGGALGNVANAALHAVGQRAPHVSLGASTALFAAVGTLAALAVASLRWERRLAAARSAGSGQREDHDRVGDHDHDHDRAREGEGDHDGDRDGDASDARAAWRRRALLAVGAALGLFAMLGTGGGRPTGDGPSLLRPVDHTDVLAHVFGLLAGALLGVVAGGLARRPPRWPWQLAAGALAFALVALSWRAALGG